MKPLSSRQRDAAQALVDDLPPHPYASVDTNARRSLRVGGAAALVGLALFLVWVCLAPLDAGVTAPGVLKVASSRTTIQHVTGGLVERILVREGAPVKRGDVLVELNKIDARAQLDIARTQFVNARALEGRLLAEREGRARIAFDPLLKSAGNPEQAEQAMLREQRLLDSRRSAFGSELQILQAQVDGLQAQLSGYEALAASRQAEARWMKQELEGLRELTGEGYSPRNRLYQLERTAASGDGAVAEMLSNIGRTRTAVAELRLRMVARRQELAKEIEQQLAEAQKESWTQADRILSLTHTLDSMDIRSPVDGVVVGLNTPTAGAVVQPGFHIMDVVPANDSLIVEAQANPDTIDKIRAGLPVLVTFPALDRHTTPRIEGRVTSVSADRLEDQRTGQPYYLVRAAVTPESMKQLHGVELKAGMAASMVVKTGERTLLSYLVKPLLDGMDVAFK